jgi:hypothetical protein
LKCCTCPDGSGRIIFPLFFKYRHKEGNFRGWTYGLFLCGQISTCCTVNFCNFLDLNQGGLGIGKFALKTAVILFPPSYKGGRVSFFLLAEKGAYNNNRRSFLTISLSFFSIMLEKNQSMDIVSNVNIFFK